jgi:hypothetical protein
MSRIEYDCFNNSMCIYYLYSCTSHYILDWEDEATKPGWHRRGGVLSRFLFWLYCSSGGEVSLYCSRESPVVRYCRIRKLYVATGGNGDDGPSFHLLLGRFED